jgi:pyridoxamine 5'-phosphate oxidase
MDLEQVRRDYLQGGLRRTDIPANPLQLFALWQEQAITSSLVDPTAMVLATSSVDGQPSQRIVLLKTLDESGFVFFTNYESRKSVEIFANPQVSLLFPWHPMERQVRVCGTAEKISPAESAKYFATRPRDSQLAAWASSQSQSISSRAFLLEQLENMKQKFAEGEVPLPDFWGGIRVKPHQIEFWQGGASRLHDRFEYKLLDEKTWHVARLAP